MIEFDDAIIHSDPPESLVCERRPIPSLEEQERGAKLFNDLRRVIDRSTEWFERNYDGDGTIRDSWPVAMDLYGVVVKCIKEQESED